MTLILLVSFFVLLLLGVPIAFCMLLSSLAALFYADINPIMIALETTRSLSAFYSFLAVPFFILAGDIMSKGGLSARLIGFVKSFIGHRRNGLPMVTVIASELFGAVSGASAATCSAIGGMMIPALGKNGYPRAFSTSLAACAGTTGALIPPSIALLLYGSIANISIEKMFIGGILPGILIGVALMIAAIRMSKKFTISVQPKESWHERLSSTGKSIWVIILMVIIFGGIMGGLFTATEASAVAVAYSLLVSLLVYKEIKIKDLPHIFSGAAKTTAALSFLLATASLFAWTLGIGRIPVVITEAMLSASDWLLNLFTSVSPETYLILRRVIVLLMLNVVLFIISMFIDVAPGLLIIVPVFLPISQAIGMGEGMAAVQFGVMCVCNMIIGLITPPVGSTLFVASGVGKVDLKAMLPYTFRFLIYMLVVQLLITYVPFFTTFLPSLLGK